MRIRFPILGLMLALVLLLTGCSLHRPEPVTLSVTPPDHYLEQPALEPAGMPMERWWQSFEDERLNDLMDELFAQNLDLEQAFARLDQSWAAMRSVRSAQYPFVNLEGELGRSMQPSFAGDFTGDNRQLAVAAGFEIDLWGRLASQTEAARKEAEASYLDLQTLYLGLAAQLADLYYFAVEQRAQLELTDRTIESFADTVQRVESRYRQGISPAIDVYQARENLAGARASRPVFEANLAVAEHAIAILIGRYPDRQSAGELARLPRMSEAFPVGLPADLLTRRPDLQASLRRVEAADARVAVRIAERFPTLNLLGSFGTSRQEFSTGLIKGEFWSLLGSLTQPVIDGGRRRAEVDRSRAVLRESLAAYRLAALRAFGEVEDALSNNRTSERRIEGLVATEQATASSLRLSLQRYLYGVTDYLPVLTAQRGHFQTQSELLTARRQLVSDRISLARALGGSWMSESIEQRLSLSLNP